MHLHYGTRASLTLLWLNTMLLWLNAMPLVLNVMLLVLSVMLLLIRVMLLWLTLGPGLRSAVGTEPAGTAAARQATGGMHPDWIPSAVPARQQ